MNNVKTSSKQYTSVLIILLTIASIPLLILKTELPLENDIIKIGELE
jgi:hypothetical protein